MSDDLKPCPFCGAGQTAMHENGRMWTGQGWSEPASVSVQHWCVPIDGQPSRMIERVGRDRDSAIAAWNMRAAVEADRARRGAVLAAGYEGGVMLSDPEGGVVRLHYGSKEQADAALDVIADMIDAALAVRDDQPKGE